jgi:beta-glucosidase
VEVRVKLTNCGEKDAEETVLVFLSCKYCSVVPYESQLKAFKRVRVAAGKSKIVRFELDETAFYYVNDEMKKQVAKGRYNIRVANKETEFVI